MLSCFPTRPGPHLDVHAYAHMLEKRRRDPRHNPPRRRPPLSTTTLRSLAMEWSPPPTSAQIQHHRTTSPLPHSLPRQNQHIRRPQRQQQRHTNKSTAATTPS
ncbi:uncharacterized protein MYCGRDRAFT_103004 [Zymoseptoria tritici IPO323]|uniref:Uncharacterized protein n=1 Tax=Zymoseptoria tritici (strain CBS 115943 / IPO323) TaxID=336722 RepID=F9X1X0_ZYMTI|nr:uncharacterized protein MYCGRDRAFT_103004 [Zymoseptoria tritici IPO323]EGP90799.1 hypothetical protein MYCGRDRAFT_103004 [Zymoseptoria tritici IPO323]